MAFSQGCDFRQTSGYVADPAGYDFVTSTTAYPVAGSGGLDIGWSSTSGLQARNRSTGVDARLAGIVFGDGINRDFLVQLPASGAYLINVALGDEGSQQLGQALEILDGLGGTVLATPVAAGTTSASGSFFDAAGNEWTAANWPAHNVQATVTFTGASACFHFTGTAGDIWSIASILVQSSGGSGTTVTADAGAAIEGLAGQVGDAGAAAGALASLRRGGVYGGLGAVYGAPLAYWGLRALDDAAASAGVKAIQLQRGSDNATMDIRVLATGGLDVASAAAFLAGTTGGVSIWYDQSGNGYDMTQATQSLQPQFQFNATPAGAPGVVFDATNTTVLRYDAGIPNTTAPLLCAAFVYPSAIGATDQIYVDSVTGGNQGFQNEGGTDSWVANFFSLDYISAASAAWHSAQLSLQVGTNAANLYLDGASNPATYSFSGSSVLLGGPDTLGADTFGLGSFRNYFSGTVAEVGWFATAPTTAELAAGYSDQEAAWVTGAAPPVGVAIEAATGVHAEPPALAEWLASGTTVDGDTAATLEFAAATRAQPRLPGAALRRQVADPPMAIAGLARQSSDAAAPVENLGAVKVVEDALLPLETLRRQQADGRAPGEGLGTQHGDTALAAESLGGLRRETPLWAEFLGRLLGDVALLVEFAGGVAVAVIGDSRLSLEWGGVVRAEVWAAAEVSGGVFTEARFPAELLVAARVADAALPLVALLRVRAELPLAAEWLGQAATIADALVPVEITRDVVVATRGANESLADAVRGAGSATETTALLLRDPPVPAEVIARVLGASATLPAQSRGVVRFAATGPAEWTAPSMPVVSLSRLLASIGRRRILKE